MWYYSTDGKQQGPFDDAALDSLIAAGTVTSATYLWKDGMTDWAPLSQVRPGAASTAAVLAVGSPDACSICGKTVGADNLLDLVGNRVCGECKPMAVQSLKEGAVFHSKNVTAWRDGKKVVAYDKTALPPRCYKCNHDIVGSPLTRKLYWHHPAWYLLLLLRAVPYLIVAIFIRKRATLDIFLCEKHLQQRKYYLIGVWVGLLLGLGLLIGGISVSNPWLSAVGGIVIIGSLVASIIGARVARAAKITKDGKVWLSGSGQDFLTSLPDWPTPGK
jgi:hypothetical protein